VLSEEIRDPAELALPEKPLDQKALTQMGKLVTDMTLKHLPLADIRNEGDYGLADGLR
jgi:hypothetical protein